MGQRAECVDENGMGDCFTSFAMTLNLKTLFLTAGNLRMEIKNPQGAMPQGFLNLLSIRSSNRLFFGCGGGEINAADFF